MTSQQIWILISMLAYLILVIAIGLIYSKRNHKSEDFFLGGRSLGPWVTAMSAEASDMSSWLLMGLPGLAYISGVGEAFWTAVGLAAGTYLNWRMVSRRLRRYSQIADNAFTLPDFFSNRFHDSKRILMTLSAIFILIFFTVYTASGFVAAGRLFESIFGFDYVTMMLISAAVIVIYTALGGFLAESTTDFIQGILMSISLVVILVGGTMYAGGLSAVIDNARSMPGFLDFFGVHNAETGAAVSYSALQVVSALAWGLGYFGMPHVLLRFMAIKDANMLKKSRVIAVVWVLISLAAAVAIGIVGSAIFPGELTGADSERVFILMSTKLLTPVLAGVILSGILAATMSTSDSQLLMTSSSISQNLFKGVLKKDASEKQVMWVSRLTVILVAAAAALMAINPSGTIFKIVSHAWAGFGATFGPLMLCALFWKRTTFKGALAGMVSGGVTALLWPKLLYPLGGVYAVYELLPAFIISLILIIVVSLLDKKPSAAIEAEFEQARSSSELI
ncbi:MAG: sodium/proline symporter PutP [Eubacteriales bacterium]|jgi:sodium/proline symporter|nr:sodium/proline symporter PutP [Eubacteriales bacterium]